MACFTTLLILILGFRCTQSAWDFPTQSELHIDLGVSIDRHQSITSEKWKRMLEFVANITTYVHMETTGSSVGLSSFDEISTLDIKLYAHNSTAKLKEDIVSQPHSGYGRDISLGIYRLRVDLFTSENGDTPGNINTGVLITNGVSDYDWAIHEAELFRATGATLISIGVGGDIDKNLLRDISGDDDKVLTATSFDELGSLVAPLTNLIVKSAMTQLYCDLDICVAVDRHESVTSPDWAHTLAYVSELAWLSAIDTYNTHFGMVSYDANSGLDIALNKHIGDFPSLYADINALAHGGSGRALDKALKSLRMECFNNSTGDRPSIPNVAILVTNGGSNPELASEEADLLKATGATVITISVGGATDVPLLVNISTNGTNNSFNVSSFQELANNPDLTLPNMCPFPPTTTTIPPTPTTTPTKEPTTTKKPICPIKPTPDPKDLTEGFKIDLGYAIDRHESINLEEWNHMLKFCADLSSRMGMAAGTRIGLVSFDEISTLDIKLNEHEKLDTLQADILDEPHQGQGRDISVGLYRLRLDLFQNANGDTTSSANIGILITNGVSDFDWAAREAEQFRKSGATLIAIGVGPGVDYNLLLEISGSTQHPKSPDCVICVDSFASLLGIHNEVMNAVITSYDRYISDDGDELSGGMIALICITVVVAIAAIAIGIIMYIKKGKNKPNPSPDRDVKQPIQETMQPEIRATESPQTNDTGNARTSPTYEEIQEGGQPSTPDRNDTPVSRSGVHLHGHS